MPFISTPKLKCRVLKLIYSVSLSCSQSSNVKICLSEPAGTPQNVGGHNTSSTSISVSWEELQAELRNGIITGYIITYQSHTENDNGIVQTDPNVRQVNVTGLKEYVEYTISVFAFTVKGTGPPSVLVVRTDQDSKWHD